MKKYTEEIIEIVLDNVTCEPSADIDDYGFKEYSIDYSLDNEKKVMKKCLAAIPEMEIKVDEQFIQEKTIDMIEVISKGKILEAMSFIRSFIKELSDKINLKGDEK